MRLQPGGVAIKALALRPRFGKLFGVSDLFHHQRDLQVSHLEILLLGRLQSSLFYLSPTIESNHPAVPKNCVFQDCCGRLFTTETWFENLTTLREIEGQSSHGSTGSP
jgi:hypothetical protein